MVELWKACSLVARSGLQIGVGFFKFSPAVGDVQNTKMKRCARSFKKHQWWKEERERDLRSYPVAQPAVLNRRIASLPFAEIAANEGAGKLGRHPRNEVDLWVRSAKGRMMCRKLPKIVTLSLVRNQSWLGSWAEQRCLAFTKWAELAKWHRDQ